MVLIKSVPLSKKKEGIWLTSRFVGQNHKFVSCSLPLTIFHYKMFAIYIFYVPFFVVKMSIIFPLYIFVEKEKKNGETQENEEK